MIDERTVADHYRRPGLLAAILAALADAGKNPSRLAPADLAPVDSFHTGGRAETSRFVGTLGLVPGARVLDMGCGLGGDCRLLATDFGARVTGIDLCADYVETGRALNERAGLADRIELRTGNALAMPFGDGTFDAAVMLHVGMNIVGKDRLFAGIRRLLQPGGIVGVYDIMRTGDGELAYPVPWADGPQTCALASRGGYRQALAGAGLEVGEAENRREHALDFFGKVLARIESKGGLPPLSLELLMGGTTAAKLRNLHDNVAAGLVAPVWMVARREE